MPSNPITKRKNHYKNIRAGRCVACYEPAMANSVYCVKHREMARIRSERNNPGIRKRYKEEHRCLRCGAPLEEDDHVRVTCVNCRSGRIQQQMAIRRGRVGED